MFVRNAQGLSDRCSVAATAVRSSAAAAAAPRSPQHRQATCPSGRTRTAPPGPTSLTASHRPLLSVNTPSAAAPQSPAPPVGCDECESRAGPGAARRMRQILRATPSLTCAVTSELAGLQAS